MTWFDKLIIKYLTWRLKALVPYGTWAIVPEGALWKVVEKCPSGTDPLDGLHTVAIKVLERL